MHERHTTRERHTHTHTLAHPRTLRSHNSGADDDERGGRACSRVPSFTYRLTTTTPPQARENVCGGEHVCLPRNKTRLAGVCVCTLYLSLHICLMTKNDCLPVCAPKAILVYMFTLALWSGEIVGHCVLLDFRFHVAVAVDVCTRGGMAEEKTQTQNKRIRSRKRQIDCEIIAVSRALNHYMLCEHFKNV